MKREEFIAGDRPLNRRRYRRSPAYTENPDSYLYIYLYLPTYLYTYLYIYLSVSYTYNYILTTDLCTQEAQNRSVVGI